MAWIDRDRRTVTYRFAYVGPADALPADNIVWLADAIGKPEAVRRLAVDGSEERAPFFVVEPTEGGPDPSHEGWSVSMQLVAMPMDEAANGWRRKSLQDCDGIVFVVDPFSMDQNGAIDAWNAVVDDVSAAAIIPESMITIVQFNFESRELLGSAGLIRDIVNRFKLPEIEACTRDGHGVVSTVKTMVRLASERLRASGRIQSGEHHDTPSGTTSAVGMGRHQVALHRSKDAEGLLTMGGEPEDGASDRRLTHIDTDERERITAEAERIRERAAAAGGSGVSIARTLVFARNSVTQSLSGIRESLRGLSSKSNKARRSTPPPMPALAKARATSTAASPMPIGTVLIIAVVAIGAIALLVWIMS